MGKTRGRLAKFYRAQTKPQTAIIELSNIFPKTCFKPFLIFWTFLQKYCFHFIQIHVFISYHFISHFFISFWYHEKQFRRQKNKTPAHFIQIIRFPRWKIKPLQAFYFFRGHVIFSINRHPLSLRLVSTFHFSTKNRHMGKTRGRLAKF